MQELKSFKKITVHLEEFDSDLDAASRCLLAKLTKNDVLFLEELLYSPIKTSVAKLADSLEMERGDVAETLEKLSPLKLFELDGTSVMIQKDRRKYFETHIEKFDLDFRAGVDYLQSYLRCLPIHLFQPWYHIPRSSNNIFDSIIEKYLLTPQTYKRYLYEAISEDALPAKVAKEILESDEQEMTSSAVKEKFELTDEEFQKLVIQLELSFLCISNYRPMKETFEEVLVPLAEWVEYLQATDQVLPSSIKDVENIQTIKDDSYPFITDMSNLLSSLFKSPIEVYFNQSLDSWAATDASWETIKNQIPLYQTSSLYLAKLINKLLILGLVIIEEDSLVPTKQAKDWLRYPIDKRTYITFKHPHNALSFIKQHEVEANSRTILEIQKSIGKIKNSGWIYLEDFLNRAIIPLHEKQQIELRKSGQKWHYDLPSYSGQERSFLKQAITEWLYESGIVRIGKHAEKDCFSLTDLGKSLFS